MSHAYLTHLGCSFKAPHFLPPFDPEEGQMQRIYCQDYLFVDTGILWISHVLPLQSLIYHFDHNGHDLKIAGKFCEFLGTPRPQLQGSGHSGIEPVMVEQYSGQELGCGSEKLHPLIKVILCYCLLHSMKVGFYL